MTARLATDSLSLHTLAELGGHTRIHFDSRGVLALLEDAYREVTGTRTNLKDHVRGAQVGLVDDSARNKREVSTQSRDGGSGARADP